MRLHSLSGIWNALGYGVNGGSVVFFVWMIGLTLSDLPVSLLFVVVPVGFLVGVGYGVAQYLLFEYELTDETFDITSGVLNRTHREIPYHRIQNIDVTQSFGKRLFGCAVLRMETAGGGSTEATLDFVSKEEAVRLQSAVRQRKRAAAETAATESEQTNQESTTEPTLLFELRPRELALLTVAFLRPGALLLVLFGIPAGGDLATTVLLSLARPLGGPESLSVSAVSPNSLLVLVGVGLPLVVVGTWVVSGLITVIEYFGFQLGRVSNDLVYQRGLFRRYSGTIPLEKIQSLTITEPVLARPLGHAGLQVETAGYAAGESERGSQSAIPFSSRDRVFELARAIEPFEQLTFTRLPARARRRYVVQYLLVIGGLIAVGYLFSALVSEFTLWYLPVVALPVAPVAAHYKWKHRGYHVGEHHISFRAGYWRRKTKVVPYYRLQTVFTSQTVFQRRLGLATLTADIASSTSLGGANPTAYDIEGEEANRLHTLLCERLQHALSSRQ